MINDVAPYTVYWPQFYTATIHQWKDLLKENVFKDIIIESLQWLVANKRIVLNGFVIMSNHIHVIWQPLNEFTPSNIQASFMKYTAQQMIRMIKRMGRGELLADLKTNKGDRNYQVWKREPLGVELFTPAVFYQKLNYIHNNPVKAGLSGFAEEYHYSSARFYHDGKDQFKMLSHYLGE